MMTSSFFHRDVFLGFFGQILCLSVPEELKNSIFEIQIILQSLNINNLKTTNAESINLPTNRKLTRYPLKHIL